MWDSATTDGDVGNYELLDNKADVCKKEQIYIYTRWHKRHSSQSLTSKTTLHGDKADVIRKKHLDVKVTTDEKTISSAGGAPRVSDIEPCGGGANKTLTEEVIDNVSYEDDDDVDFIVNFK